MPELAPVTLAALAGDDAQMAALRVGALLLADGSDWSRHDDHEVIMQMGVARTQGRLVTHAPPAARLFRLAPSGAPASPAPTPAPGPRAAPASSSAAAETTFSVALDTTAMVAALRQAAQDGAPFCEECERAAAARRHGAS